MLSNALVYAVIFFMSLNHAHIKAADRAGEVLKTPKSYISINPKLKLGKFENGNYFMDFVPAKFNWHVNPWFSFSGGASVGFTAPRNAGLGSLNHYMNRLTVRATYRPLGRLGLFAEANFSNLIDGNNSPVTYFRTGNYQAIGVEYRWLEITN